jgi:hypothetical protein
MYLTHLELFEGAAGGDNAEDEEEDEGEYDSDAVDEDEDYEYEADGDDYTISQEHQQQWLVEHNLKRKWEAKEKEVREQIKAEEAAKWSLCRKVGDKKKKESSKADKVDQVFTHQASSKILTSDLLEVSGLVAKQCTESIRRLTSVYHFVFSGMPSAIYGAHSHPPPDHAQAGDAWLFGGNAQRQHLPLESEAFRLRRRLAYPRRSRSGTGSPRLPACGGRAHVYGA